MQRLSKNSVFTRRSAALSPISTIAKVSHTLDPHLAGHLEEFAFRQRLSESSVIEFALRIFFRKGDDERLGRLMRRSGAGRRRKTIAKRGSV